MYLHYTFYVSLYKGDGNTVFCMREPKSPQTGAGALDSGEASGIGDRIRVLESGSAHSYSYYWSLVPLEILYSSFLSRASVKGFNPTNDSRSAGREREREFSIEEKVNWKAFLYFMSLPKGFCVGEFPFSPSY